MHQHSDTQVEIKSEFHIWKYNGQEIGAYRTQNAAEAHLRRALRAGWGEKSMYLLDKDGNFLFAGGIATGHTVTKEIRNAITGV